MKAIKKLGLISLLLVMVLALAACNGGNTGNNAANDTASTTNNTATDDTATTNDAADETTDAPANDLGEIIVVSREDGSGTRGAFTEITGVLEEDDAGNETDNTYAEALIQNSTNGVMQTVANDEAAIGYISLGSLNDTVKTLNIDGVAATAEEIIAGNYPIARPFIVATKGEATGLAADFINFITSEEGQTVSEGEGYVKVDQITPYEQSEQTGRLVVAGSTSVTPVMEKLAEAYQTMYPEVSIEIQSTGSSAGIQAATDGAADIGMSSRELKEEELAELTPVTIAMDGIAVIVNNANPTEDMTLEGVKSVFTGETTDWAEVQ